MAVAFGVGFTVMVKLFDGPAQLTPPLVNVGVTVIVPVMGAVVVLVAVNVGKLLPVPTPPNPILILLFDQA